MIPAYHIQHWSSIVPWASFEQVEQDLIISRALIELYQSELLQKSLIFRGGTALNKIYFQPPLRYSEDLDFVDILGGDNGEKIAHIRQALDYWLGKPQYDVKEQRVILRYRFVSTTNQIPLKLKVEINAHENFHVSDLKIVYFSTYSEWFQKDAKISTYCLEELLATKLRALYQRKKGRDLFDIYMGLKLFPDLDVKKLISTFEHYLAFNNQTILQKDFINNMDMKIKSPAFREDILPLLPKNIKSTYDAQQAYAVVKKEILELL